MIARSTPSGSASATMVGAAPDRLCDVLRDVDQFHSLARDLVAAPRLELRQREQLLDKAADALRLAMHDLEKLPRSLGIGAAAEERLGIALDGGDGRAQLVGDVRDEVAPDRH